MNNEEALTGRQRIGNNIVDGQSAGSIAEILTPRGHSVAVVTIRGEISLETFEDRSAALSRAARPGCRALIVDLAEVPFIDCAGFGMLLCTCRRLKAEGRGFAVIHASPFLQRALQLAGLHKILRGYGSREAALEALDLEALDLEALDLEALDLEALDLEALDLEALDLEAPPAQKEGTPGHQQETQQHQQDAAPRRAGEQQAQEASETIRQTITRLPIPLTRLQQACLYLHEWQQTQCGRLCVGPGAAHCGQRCQLPSVGMTQRYAGVRHTTAQRARKLIAASPESKCLTTVKKSPPE